MKEIRITLPDISDENFEVISYKIHLEGLSWIWEIGVEKGIATVDKKGYAYTYKKIFEDLSKAFSVPEFYLKGNIEAL